MRTTHLALTALFLTVSLHADAHDFRRAKYPGAERLRVSGNATVYDSAGQPKRSESGRSIEIQGDVAYVDASGPQAEIEPQNSAYAKLAAHWAPVWMQDTDSSKTVADYLTIVDYDGDWITTNNWEHLDTWKSPVLSSLRNAGAVYWWLVETKTHWFIGYGTYHPRDWEDSDGAKNWVKYNVFAPLNSLRTHSSGEHENDMEGALLTIRKDGGNGTLELIDTQAHNNFWQAGTLEAIEENGKKRETIDGDVTWNGGRPVVYIQAKGHGNYPIRGHTDYSGTSGDGLVYRYTADGQAAGKDEVDYALVPMRVIWDRWNRAPRTGNETFAPKDKWTAFAGDTKDHNSANPPWGWRDKDYPASVNATFFSQPAKFVSWRFKSKSGKPFSTEVVGRSCP